MNRKTIAHVLFLTLLSGGIMPLHAAVNPPPAGTANPRNVVLTDIVNEPDDARSMVGFLLYSNQFDVEGRIATTSTHLRDRTAEWRIGEIVHIVPVGD